MSAAAQSVSTTTTSTVVRSRTTIVHKLKKHVQPAFNKAIDWSLGEHDDLDGQRESNIFLVLLQENLLVVVCATILVIWVLVVAFQFSGNLTQTLTTIIGPSVSWLALTYTARSYSNQVTWKKQDCCLAQLATDLSSKQFRCVMKIMQQTNDISPIYLLNDDLTAAAYTSEKYVKVSRVELDGVFTPVDDNFEYTAVQQDLRRYLRQFLAAMYCYNQMRRLRMFYGFEFLVALRFKTISLCYNNSIFAEPVLGKPQFHDKLHYFASINHMKHTYWGCVSLIRWLGPASNHVHDTTFDQWEREMVAFRKAHKQSAADMHNLEQFNTLTTIEEDSRNVEIHLHTNTNLKTV